MAEWFNLEERGRDQWHLRTGEILEDETILTACNMRVKVSAIADTRADPPFERECSECRAAAHQGT